MLYGFDNKYPYTDFHELNLDWILSQVVALRSDMRNFVRMNTIKYADPIQWSITTQYEANTVVVDPATGNAYISSQPVPVGVSLTDTDYWSEIGNFSTLYESIKQSVAAADDGDSLTATAPRTEGSLVWLHGVLYKVLSNISTGALYITSGAGQNVEEVTVEELINELNIDITNVSNHVDAVETSLNNALNERIYIYPEDYGAVGDGSTDDTLALTDCVADSTDKIIVLRNTYRITDVINLPSNTIIIGVGDSSLIDDLRSGSSDVVRRYEGLFNIENVENVTIKDVTFKGYAIGQIQSNSIYRNSDIGILYSSKINIIGCRFLACDLFTQIGVYRSTDVTIINNQITYHRWQGIAVCESKRVNVSDNIITNSGCNAPNDNYAITFNYLEDATNSCSDIICCNNNITYPDASARSNHESIDAHGIKNAVIKGNNITDAYNAIVVFSEVSRNFSAIRTEITNNNIIQARHYGIVFGGTQINVTNNNLILCGSSSGGGVYVISECNSCKISGNNINGAYNRGIYFVIDPSKKVRGLMISDNLITDIIPSGGYAKILEFANQTEATFYLVSTFENNVCSIDAGGAGTLQFDMPTAAPLTGSFITCKNNYYDRIPEYTNFQNIAPDLLDYANRNNVDAGEIGHVITMGDTAGTSGTVVSLQKNTSAYFKITLP